MVQPERDPAEDSLLEEEATRAMEGLSDAGVISFASKSDLPSFSLRL